MDITEPVDENFWNIIEFETGSSELPLNPYGENEKEHQLFEELITTITEHIDDICAELVFALTYDDENASWNNHSTNLHYNIDMEKVII